MRSCYKIFKTWMDKSKSALFFENVSESGALARLRQRLVESLRLTWGVQWVPGHYGLHIKTLSQRPMAIKWSQIGSRGWHLWLWWEGCSSKSHGTEPEDWLVYWASIEYNAWGEYGLRRSCAALGVSEFRARRCKVNAGLNSASYYLSEPDLPHLKFLVLC